MSQLRSKPSAKAPPPENSLATGGSNAFLVTALDWSKNPKEERKKEDHVNDSDFWPFQVQRRRQHSEVPGGN